MRGYLDRDAYGFWGACVVIEQARRSGASGAGDVRTRHTLPGPASAPREVAETAFRRFMSREARKRHGR